MYVISTKRLCNVHIAPEMIFLLGNAQTYLSRYCGEEAGHQEDTPWEYQYPTAPPYNGGGSGGYGGGHRGPTDQYPTGPIPYNSQQQPLIADQPPRYQDVAYSNYRDSGKIQY